MNTRGGNNYKIKHRNKEQLYRNGLLPISIRCNQEAVDTVKQSITTSGNQ